MKSSYSRFRVKKNRKSLKQSTINWTTKPTSSGAWLNLKWEVFMFNKQNEETGNVGIPKSTSNNKLIAFDHDEPAKDWQNKRKHMKTLRTVLEQNIIPFLNTEQEVL